MRAQSRTRLTAHRFGLLLLTTASFYVVTDAQELEVKEYRLPRVEQVYENVVHGYYEPGCLEFEAYVGRPFRDLHGLDLQQMERDELTLAIMNVFANKGEGPQPVEDSRGNLWMREASHEERRCGLYTLSRNDTVVYRFRDCFAVENPAFYVRDDHWWIRAWCFTNVEDTNSFLGSSARGFQVIVDSELLSDRYDYSETFDYHYVGGSRFSCFAAIVRSAGIITVLRQ